MMQLERLWYWIAERESIRLKKEAGKEKPWTSDPILQKFRFCNVRRMDDRVSRWLLNNWYVPYKNHKNMLLAATLARNLNRIEAFEAVGFPTRWDPQRIESILNRRKEKGLCNFGGAYMITGRLHSSKISQTVQCVVDNLRVQKIRPNTNSLERTARDLIPMPGFSSFLAGQVAADLRWALDGEWKDRYSWSARGPGSMRGLNRLHGRLKRTLLTEAWFLEELREVMRLGSSVLPHHITSRMEAIDWQNCLCELDKYERERLGEGHPKQRYPGV